MISPFPVRFEYVLNFLRNGYIVHVDTDGDELFDVLEKEAQFYGISEMANLCRTMREPLRLQVFDPSDPGSPRVFAKIAKNFYYTHFWGQKNIWNRISTF